MNRVQGIVLIIVAFFLVVSLFSYTNADPPDSLVFPATEGYKNLCGKWGAYTASVLFNTLGVTAYLIFVPIIALIYYRWYNKAVDQLFLRILGLVLIFSGISGFVCLNMTGTWHGPIIGPGGHLGVTIVYFLNSYFSSTGMTIIFVCMLLGGLVLACDNMMIHIVMWLFGLRPIIDNNAQNSGKRERLPKQQADRFVQTLSQVKDQNAEIDELSEDEEEENEPEYTTEDDEEIGEDWNDENEEESDDEAEEELEDEEEYEYAEEEIEEEDEEPPIDLGPVEPPVKKSTGLISWFKTKLPKEDPPQEDAVAAKQIAEEETDETENKVEYDLPAIDLLIESEKHDDEQQMQIAKRQARKLEEAFANFGLNIKVVDIQCGPVIAQFEVELERGLRLSKITNLTDDLAIALRVPTVRIVAPIPGKNSVGVEVPNKTRQLVRLREVIEEMPEKAKSKAAIPIFLGKDVAGAPMMIDLAKMPHLLIAGRTGTGKSVCLNSIIVSILMTKTPEECRMIMIDPKMVELSQYESIPHLMHPVVIDMKKAEAILAWAVDKMEQRYQILNRAKVRQLSEYNALGEEELYRRVNHPNPITQEEWDDMPKSLPYTVIVIDEMADLMMTSAKEVETHIIRLAAKSRAIGIHLVLATQKPTVDIITGLIKSNLPARIAFEVATRVDSQVVLDRNGAEKLLGNGDMLFLKPGTSQVLRGQGTYVSDPEINDVLASIATDTPNYVIELVELQTGDETADNIMVDPRDELYNEAVEYIIREARGSVSLLQRKFKIGYGRAARLVDFMEEDGIVGPSKGSQPRDVTLTLQQWRARLAELENAFNATKAVDKSALQPPPAARMTEMNHPPKPKGMSVGKPPKEPSEDEQYDIDNSSSKTRQNAGAKAKVNVEPGLGPIAEVDDSMLAEVQPNIKRRKLTPHQRETIRRETVEIEQYDDDEETPPFEVYHGGDYGNEDEDDSYNDDDGDYDNEYEVEDASDDWDEDKQDHAEDNVFGVVPVVDGDVDDDADDGEWEYEYEYVYEEIDDDDDDESYDDINPEKHYVEDVNLEAGGDWESEEDWGEDETEDNELDNEEEYDEYEYEDWDEDELDEEK